MINNSEEEYEHSRYRNMLFRLYNAFFDYRDMIIKNGGSDPEGWEMDKDLETLIRLEDRFVDHWGISVRAINVLRSHGCDTYMDVVQLTEKELKETPACGKKTLNEIKELLAEYGLELGMDVSEYKKNRWFAYLPNESLAKK